MTGHLTPSWSHNAVIPLFFANSPVRFVNGVHFAIEVFDGEVDEEATAFAVEGSIAVAGTGTAVASDLRGTAIDRDDSAWRKIRGIASVE